MWEGLIKRPLDIWTAGRFLAFASVILIAAFSYLLLIAPNAQAAEGDATWEGGNLVYDGKTFEGPNTANDDNPYEIPSGVQFYRVEERDGASNAGHIIYIPGGADTNQVSEAEYLTYSRSGTRVSNISAPQSIAIDTTTSEEASPGYVAGENSEVTSCAIEGGLGWVICPVTNTLARGMDWVFEVLDGFLEVQPLSTTTGKNAMLEAWKVMRVIANVAFVIAFLVIIYSQLTSMGISNYGIKKLFPRLIVGAILVNISYWICAIAIDLSNILGATFQDMFIDMRNYLVEDVGSDTSMLVSWESVAGGILSGGALAGVAIGGGALALANISMAGTGAVFLLLPILVSAFLTLLVVLLILAARQAIITILVVLSPLAFVAYLLPNTESWFEKWRSTFMTMLILFPAFSIVFGGSQLAGLLIILNADDITVLLLGMAVQIAPLAIVPLLLKLGGTLLTRIAGIVNNPNRGLIDRTRNWSNERFNQAKAERMAESRRMAGDTTNGGKKKFNRSPLRRFGVHWDDARRAREGQQKIDEQVADTMFGGSDRGMALHEAEHNANQLKERVTSEVGKHLQDKINVQGSDLHLDNVKVEVAKAELAKAKGVTESQLEEYRTNSPKFAPWADNLGELKDAAKALQFSTEQISVQGLRKQSATLVKNKDFAELMSIENDDITNPRYTEAQNALRAAAGIDPGGRLRAQANAMSDLVKMEDEGLTKSLQLMNAQAIRQGTTLKDYTAKIADIGMNGNKDKDGNTYNYSPLMVEAALEQQAKEGQVGIMEQALRSEHIDHDSIMRVIARNSGTMKGKGGFHVQADPGKLSIHEIMKEIQVEQPNLSHTELLTKAQDQFDMRIAFERMDVLATTGAEDISGFKVGYFNNVLAGEMENNIKLARQYAKQNNSDPSKKPINIDKTLENAFFNIHEASTNTDIRSKMSDRNDSLTHMDTIFKKEDIRLKTTTEEAEKSKTEKDEK